MIFYDLMAMSLGNLWRRKLRTMLTVLGVLIGTISIVSMISLALGMRKMLLDQFSSIGSATQIQVTSSTDLESGSDNLDMDTLLTDDNMWMFEEMEYVKSVTPSLRFDTNLQQGKYYGYANLIGVSPEVLESQELGEGELPSEGGNTLQVLAGNTILSGMGYFVGDEYYGYYSTGELPDIDLINDVKQLTFYDYTAMSNAMDADVSGDADIVDDGTDDVSGETDMGDSAIYEDNSEQHFRVKVTGILEGGPDDYGEYSDSLLVDIDSLKSYLSKNYGKGNIPGQPKNNGKFVNNWVYNIFYVDVDDTSHVEEVMQNIRDMGFEANSNKELLDSVQQTMQVVQLVLGGIGMVAFLVAAIGIANTMMMSTYERTKEIGVMKVLGCNMRDIQKLFLMEAGFIGLIGGIIGLGFTCALSAFINSMARAAEGMNGDISLITWWLAVVAVAFSTLVGMLAGYFPARRAMKLSPLAAIRTE